MKKLPEDLREELEELLEIYREDLGKARFPAASRPDQLRVSIMVPLKEVQDCGSSCLSGETAMDTCSREHWAWRYVPLFSRDQDGRTQQAGALTIRTADGCRWLLSSIWLDETESLERGIQALTQKFEGDEIQLRLLRFEGASLRALEAREGSKRMFSIVGGAGMGLEDGRVLDLEEFVDLLDRQMRPFRFDAARMRLGWSSDLPRLRPDSAASVDWRDALTSNFFLD